MARAVRQWLTARISERAVQCAPWLSEAGVARLERVIAWAGPRCPVIRRIIADNMRAVHVYSPTIHREYFRQVAGQLTGWLHVFRHAVSAHPAPTDSVPPGFAKVVAERTRLDDSAESFTRAASAGKGVIVMGTHIADPPMWLARMNQLVPTTAYARYSKDARRQQVKERWWRTMGLGYVSEPAHMGQRGARIAKMAEVLSQGRAVLITPDLARKRGDGRPVRFFDREIYLPSGPAVLSVTTGAPLMILTARAEGCANCLSFHGPFAGQIRPGMPESDEAAITERMQWYAHQLEAFLREQPPLWFLWGDKRWTRVFRGDPQYVRFPARDEEEAATDKPTHGGA